MFSISQDSRPRTQEDLCETFFLFNTGQTNGTSCHAFIMVKALSTDIRKGCVGEVQLVCSPGRGVLGPRFLSTGRAHLSAKKSELEAIAFAGGGFHIPCIVPPLEPIAGMGAVVSGEKEIAGPGHGRVFIAPHIGRNNKESQDEEEKRGK
jgi:hypothetical protein